MLLCPLLHLQGQGGSGGIRAGSSEGAVRPVEGGVRLVAALAVHVLRVSVDAVATLHLGDGRRRVGSGAQSVRVVPHTAAQLQVVLVPVAPQDRLDLDAQTHTESFSSVFSFQVIVHSTFLGHFGRF